MYYIYLLVCSVVFSFLVAEGAKMLDDLLDYGNILDRFRYRKAKRAACSVGMHDFETTAQGLIKEAPDYDSRAEAMNELYWFVALKNKNFKLWMCPLCMSLRAMSFLCWVQVIAFSTYFGFELEILLIPIVNLILTYRFVR